MTPPPSKGILRSKYPLQSGVRAPVRGGVRVGHHPGQRGLEPGFESPFSEQNVISILGSVSGCPRRKEHALSAWQVSPSWYGLGLSAQTAHFGRRGRDPHPCPRVRQREKAPLTQMQHTQKGCVFARPAPVRFLHRIKGGGRVRPPPTHKAPQCGASSIYGKVVGKWGQRGFRWSPRCGMPTVSPF